MNDRRVLLISNDLKVKETFISKIYYRQIE